MSEETDNKSSDGVTDSPKKGPTLSTSTSSFEPLDPHDPNLSHLANNLFQKTSDYLLSELQSTREDYELLEKMNEVTCTKYSDLRQITEKAITEKEKLDQQYEKLLGVVDHVDRIGKTVSQLEEAAYKLDMYSKKLEERYKILEKRYAASTN